MRVLIELEVRNLGVIERALLDLSGQMEALTGETGAGKTMVVEALQLLAGGRADPARVRSGESEAEVGARFATPDGQELVVRRIIRTDGPSKAYLNGRMATATELGEVVGAQLEVVGQHSQQKLLTAGSQRRALDDFAGVELDERRRLQSAVREIEQRIESLGGDERTRLRELDVLNFQLNELDGANLVDPLEDEGLSAEEDVLADAVAHRQAAELAAELLGGEGSAYDLASRSLAAVADRAPFEAVHRRLAAIAAELGDAVSELRAIGDTIEPDPQRLEVIRSRRHQLVALRRKYGDTLGSVIEAREELRQRADELERTEELTAKLERELADLRGELRSEEQRIRALRSDAAPKLARAIETHLANLALAGAKMSIRVSEAGAGDDVMFEMSANSGMAPAPLGKAASGGELSRVMLAIRLVLTAGPPTLVFDEVDAGIGGATAIEIGKALRKLSERHQVVVVTHLAQVAAFAGSQYLVEKSDDGERVNTQVRSLEPAARLAELSRMLSGMPDSDSGRSHATELLALAASLTAG